MVFLGPGIVLRHLGRSSLPPPCVGTGFLLGSASICWSDLLVLDPVVLVRHAFKLHSALVWCMGLGNVDAFLLALCMVCEGKGRALTWFNTIGFTVCVSNSPFPPFRRHGSRRTVVHDMLRHVRFFAWCQGVSQYGSCVVPARASKPSQGESLCPSTVQSASLVRLRGLSEFGNGPNTVLGSTVSNTKLSEFFGAH